MGDPLNQTTAKAKPCEICGNIGYVVALIVCSKCSVTREHVYCMSVMCDEDRENWICDECDVSNKKPASKPATSKQPSGTGLQFSLKKPPQNTKVRYITPEEIRSLESGATRNKFPSPSKSFLAHRSSVNKTLVSKTKANASSSATRSNLCIRPNPQVGFLGRRDPSNKQIGSTSLREKKLAASTEKEDSVLYCQNSPVAKQQSSARVIPKSNVMRKETNGSARQRHGEILPAKRVTFEKFPIADANSNNVDSEDTPRESVQCLAAANSEKGAQQVSWGIPTSKGLPVEKISKGDINAVHTPQFVQSFPNASLGVDVYADPQQKITDFKGREAPGVTLVFDRHLPNHPAVSPTWRGTLKIMNDVLPFSSFDDIQAYPPCKVNTKAFMFSKQLPKTLQYELLPERNSWENIFKEDVPDELDIGLYFFQATTSNLSGDYCSLLEYLDVRGLFLRTCMEGVELFVFSSKHLPESSRMINEKHFLWGMFRPFPLQAQKSMSGELKDEDMDIDMLGGREVGKVDTIVAKYEDHTCGEIKESEKDSSTEMDIDMLGGHEVGKVDIIVAKNEDPTCGEIKESEKASSTGIKASPVSTAGLLVGFPPVKIEKEWTEDIGTSLAFASPVVDEEEFDKELQNSFDKFVALMDFKSTKTDIKKEVSA